MPNNSEELIIINELTGKGHVALRMKVHAPQTPPELPGRSHHFVSSFVGEFDEMNTYLPSERMNMSDRKY